MATIKVGDRVRVLDSAFGDSTHPDDVVARGKIGKVILVDDRYSEIEVQTKPDDDFLLLSIDEVEVIEAAQVDA